MGFNSDGVTISATKKQIKTAWAILIGVALLILVIWSSSSYSYNSALKDANKTNKRKIDSIQDTKRPLLDSLEAVGARIKQKEAYIVTLEAEETSLTRKLNYSKNENKRIKDSYRNSTISQRVELWAKLTIENDSTPAASN